MEAAAVSDPYQSQTVKESRPRRGLHLHRGPMGSSGNGGAGAGLGRWSQCLLGRGRESEESGLPR